MSTRLVQFFLLQILIFQLLLILYSNFWLDLVITVFDWADFFYSLICRVQILILEFQLFILNSKRGCKKYKGFLFKIEVLFLFRMQQKNNSKVKSNDLLHEFNLLQIKTLPFYGRIHSERWLFLSAFKIVLLIYERKVHIQWWPSQIWSFLEWQVKNMFSSLHAE